MCGPRGRRGTSRRRRATCETWARARRGAPAWAPGPRQRLPCACLKNFARTALRAGTAGSRAARARRDDRASSEARPHGVRPSCRPLHCCCCPSRACWTPPECCTQVPQTRLVKHMQHDCCWQVQVLVGHGQLHHGPPGQAQLARHARARRRGQEASWAAQPSTSSCTRRAAVRDLQSWPTCSTPEERPPHDLSIGMRLVGAGSELPGCAALADEPSRAAAAMLLGARGLLRHSSLALKPQHSPNLSPRQIVLTVPHYPSPDPSPPSRAPRSPSSARSSPTLRCADSTPPPVPDQETESPRRERPGPASRHPTQGRG